MRLFFILVGKDLRRLRHNPWVLLINLALPFVITALMGFAFGGKSSDKGMGTIKLAIVDEDDSPLSNFLRSAFQQGEAKEHLQPMVMSRADAMASIRKNEISAVVVLPENFAGDYLNNRGGLKIELIKNPAQSFYPAIVEEMLGVLVEGLNALSLNLGSDMAEWVDVFKQDQMPDFLKLSGIYLKLDERSKALKDYLSPPLVVYETETTAAGEDAEAEARPLAQVFAYLLPGLASMFLLFIADGTMRDVFREIRFRTLDRYLTLHHRLLAFIGSKVVTTMTTVFVGGVVIFFVSGLVFQFRWNHPLAVIAMILSYSICASGLLALCSAIARSEKRADTINITLIIGMSFLGGAYFPAKNLPAFFYDHISGHLPNYWFVETIRSIHFDGGTDWILPAAKLVILGTALMVAAAALFRRQLQQGVRA